MADEDTIQADAAGDTIEADVAADTLEAGAGDSIQADAGEPFADFDDPSPPKEEEAPVTVAADAGPDDYDKELAAIEAEADVDPVSATKKLVALNRKQRKQDVAEKAALRSQVATAAHDAGWNRFEYSAGLHKAPPEVREKLNREALQKRLNKHYAAEIRAGANHDEANGAARATLKHEIQLVVGKVQPKKKLAKVKAEGGAVLHPPGGASGRANKPLLSPEEQFDQGNWELPN